MILLTKWPRTIAVPDTELFYLIVYMLRSCLSPKQISGELKVIKLHDLCYAFVCREPIYTTIYALPVGHLRKRLIHWQNIRQPRRSEVDRHGQISNMARIHLHLPKASKREMPGHWKGNLINGKNRASAVGALIELSRGFFLAKMDDPPLTSAVVGFSAAANRIPTTARKSMIYGQGCEMAQHAKITHGTGVAIYFCD